MRTIKFRAWMVEEKFMMGWEQIKNTEVRFPIGAFGNTEEYWERMSKLIFCVPDSKIVAQQFTGWLDCDEKEIYEGDLVSFSTSSHSHGPGKEFYENMRVSWCEDFGGWEFISGRGMGELALSVFADCIDTESFVITGNIFENPELGVK